MTSSNRYDDESELAREIRKAVLDAQVEVANYSEGNHTFLKWVLGLCGVLTSAGVIGGIAMYAKLSAVETKVEERTLNLQRQADERERNLERQIEEVKQLIRNHP